MHKAKNGNLHKLSIGYATANLPLSHPAYRRRFAFYLKSRELHWELAEWRKSYDIVVVHHSADLPRWSRYDKGRVILDYNDDYLALQLSGLRNRTRGIARYLSRNWTSFCFDFRAAYKQMMARADAIVCCTSAQRSQASKYCSNIHRILDMQADPDWNCKLDYRTRGTFSLVWEGLPSFSGLHEFKLILARLSEQRPVAMHLLTSLKHGRFLNTFAQVNTKDEIDKLFPSSAVYLYEWNPILFSHIVTGCDLAVIPIDMEDPFWVGKPANKLLFFWRLGMPVLTDATPAYMEMMDECGLDMVCHSREDWLTKAERYLADEEARRVAGRSAHAFVQDRYSNERLLDQWESVLESVM